MIFHASVSKHSSPFSIKDSFDHTLQERRFIPSFAIISLYLLYVGFGLATARHSGAEDDLGAFGELVRLLTLGPAYLLSAFIFISHKKTLLPIASKCWLYVLFIAYSGLSSIWSSFPNKVLLHNAHDIGYFLVGVLLVGFLRERGPIFLFKHLALASLIFIAASIVVSIKLPAIGTFRGNRWQGIAGNPNTFGMFCVSCIWFLLMLYNLHQRFYSKLLCLIGLSVPLIALTGGVSITSVTSLIISLFFCSALPTITVLLKGGANSRLLKVFLFFLLFLSGVISLFAFFPEIFDIDYVLAGLGRDRTMTGRTKIWDLGLLIFSKKPWFGWSFDALLSVMHTLKFDITQFHNGYLDLLIRGGTMGFLILALIVISTYSGIFKVLKNNGILGWGLTVFVSGFLLHNMSEASIMRPTHLYWFTFMLVYIIARNHALISSLNKLESNGR